jgi:hypothetical protein
MASDNYVLKRGEYYQKEIRRLKELYEDNGIINHIEGIKGIIDILILDSAEDGAWAMVEFSKTKAVSRRDELTAFSQFLASIRYTFTLFMNKFLRS